MKKIVATFLLLPSIAFAGNSFIIKFNKDKINLPQQKNVDCSNLTNLTLISTKTYNYNGTYGWDGSPQIVSLPTNTQCIKAKVAAGGGAHFTTPSYHAGGGDLVTGTLKVDSNKNYELVVAGYPHGYTSNYSTSQGDSGGLSGIFNGTPSQSTAMLVAGGGSANGQGMNGFDGSLNPDQPSNHGASKYVVREMGYGAEQPSAVPPQAATPFGNGGYYNAETFGAYGGGGGDLNVGVAGAGGMPGGEGGATYCNDGYSWCPGGAGKSYYSSNILNFTDNPGQGGQGGTSSHENGYPGWITLSFYK